ncbi:NAD-dependent protein deacetylase sirtuin-1 [Lissotriton helveticus]
MADEQRGPNQQSSPEKGLRGSGEPVAKRSRADLVIRSTEESSGAIGACLSRRLQASEVPDRGTSATQHTEPSEEIGQAPELRGNGSPTCDSDEDDRISHASSSDWTPRPRIGPYTFVQQHLLLGTDPRTILNTLLPDTIPPQELDDMTLWQIVINLLSEPPKRKRRKDINTIADVVKLLAECKRILVLTGAGVSVSCGIPDFRSRDGIYARLAVDFPDLPDPQAMFDIDYFKKDPRPFFKFAKEIYPGQFQPSLCHKFIAMLDKDRKLLRNYTQNIDTLEQVAGIQRVIQCHGSFASASCLTCRYKVDSEAVRGDIFNQVVPRCPRCLPNEPLAIMKPDIVFFGENLPEQFHRAMKYDKDEVDLLIVIGSSLKVRPVALIPSSIPQEVPQILINREPLNHLHFDVELLGDCDVIINELCQRLGSDYAKLGHNLVKLSETSEKPLQSQKDLEKQCTGLPLKSVKISEDPHLLEQVAVPGPSLTVPTSEDVAYKPSHSGFYSKPSLNCVEENVQELRVHISTNTFFIDNEPLVKIECLKEARSNEHNKINDERKFEVETQQNNWNKKSNKKEPISKRLASTQYLYLTPNRYIFHGAEVYSDSDDVISSSSCGSSDESESCPSFGECTENDSDNDECYSAVENETSVSTEVIESCIGENEIKRTMSN